MKERLPVETFDIPASEIRFGWRSAVYFSRAKQVASKMEDDNCTMQIFQKSNAVLCGMDEALAVLKIGAGRWKNAREAELLFDQYMEAKLASRGTGRDVRYSRLHTMINIEDELDDLWESEWDDVDVYALCDGDRIEPWETVMSIQGRYSAVAHLESVYLGVLARRTLVATNTRRVCDAANGKPVLFFADRFDHWANQGGDGHAAYVGGATGFASDAMGAWWGEKGMGTMPHALIALHNGDTVAAARAFHKEYPDTNLIPLVDFNNDSCGAAVDCAEEFGPDLWGVRLDTSENMVDASLYGYDGYGCWEPQRPMGDFKPTGVNPTLVQNVRDALDREGHQHVKIIVSGGFNPEKIAAFEETGVPVDSYAVGSSLLRGVNDYTADVVIPASKSGRWYRPNERLESEG